MRTNLDVGFVVDVEATCWETKEEQGNKPNEIIEIGVAQLNFRNGAVVDRASIIVKPRYTTVSPFCTQLTGWTQEEIDRDGLDIVEALKQFKEIFKPGPEHLWFSCGDYDRNMLSSMTNKGVGKLYMVARDANPFDHMKHINIKTLFALKHNLQKEAGMERMLSIIGEKLEGRHHNGADDALNIAKIVKHVLL